MTIKFQNMNESIFKKRNATCTKSSYVKFFSQNDMIGLIEEKKIKREKQKMNSIDTYN